MKRLFLISICILLAGCCTRQVCMTKTPNSRPFSHDQMIAGMNAFSADLYTQLEAGNKDNIFYSPFSISAAMSLLYTGARGETADNLQKVLHFGPQHETFSSTMGEIVTTHSAKDDQTELRSSQSLWVNRYFELKPAYEKAMVVDFKSSVRSVDFRNKPMNAKKMIDDWVAKVTRNRIKEIIPADGVGPDTRLILVNAIYFNGEWQYPFNEKKTRDMPFYRQGGESEMCSMMYQRKHFQYFETKQYQVLELPYKGRRYSMVIVLPKQKEGIRHLKSGLTPEIMAQFDSSAYREDMIVYLPKFEFRTKYKLNDSFQNMGLTTLFNRKCNLSGISESENLFVSYVIHKAFIKVDEKSTEAAAATAVGIRVTSMPPVNRAPVEFKADHPFAFGIRDNKDKALIFSGQLAYPE